MGIYMNRNAVKIYLIMKWVLLFSFLSTTLAAKRKGECLIVPNKDFGHPQPLILQYSSPYEVLYPNVDLQNNEHNGIKLNAGDKFKMACPGNSFQQNRKNVDVVTCVDQLTFNFDNKNIAFNQIKCVRPVTPHAQWTVIPCNGDKMQYIEIGYSIQKDFLRLFKVCFDDIKKIAIYSVHVERPVIDGYQRNYQRTEFTVGEFYKNVPMNTVYTIANQKARFKTIFNSEILANKYIGGLKDGHYLARGHLTAKIDLLFGPEQVSTFFYVNAVPQWQSFNAGNWFALEDNVRKFVNTHDKNVNVYTGTYGVLRLPDERGELKELYMYTDHNNNNILPIPKLIYKVLHSETVSAGVAFIGVNNPHLQTIPGHYFICPDICDKIPWLKIDRRNIGKGYIYCCEIKEFVKQVKSLPNIQVNNLLTK